MTERTCTASAHGGRPRRTAGMALLSKPPLDAPLWVMLTALAAVVAMSQAFRTIAALVAGELQAELGASPQALGVFAGAFHLSFALAQIPMGVALDIYGPRRTVAAASAAAVLGVAVSAAAPSFPVLVLGQLLIGVGSAPAFLGTIVFVARRYPPDRFTRLSGLVLSFSGIGMLITGTPLAWVVEAWSWRAGFVALGAGATLVLLAVVLFVADPPQEPRRERETLHRAFQEIRPILAQRHTAGILALGAAAYAAFITLRGLWAVPMLIERHGFTLVESGNVMLVASVAALVGPPVFGLLTLGDRARRAWIIGGALASAGTFAALALAAPATVDVASTVLLGFLTGYFILQYADVRAAYCERVAGRALAVFNAAVFLGVALMQWITGLAASIAGQHGADPLTAACGTIAALLVAGTVAYAMLPWPPGMRRAPGRRGHGVAHARSRDACPAAAGAGR